MKNQERLLLDYHVHYDFSTQVVNKQKFKKRKQQSCNRFVKININLTYEKY